MLPPSVDQVLDGLARYPEALAVIYTSPTYEGLCANTRAIADAVHAASGHAILFVDEAWGGHLHFHPELPPSAMDGGADIAVQSTHKLAGGLQQTGLIHWREARVDSELMEEAFREYVTTSPSYHLLASADAAVRSLAATGRDALGVCIAPHATSSRRCCASGSRGCASSTRPAWLDRHCDARRGLRHGQDDGCADRATTSAASRSRRRSSSAGIVVEKAGVNTLTFITTFQLEEAAIEATRARAGEILAGRELAPTAPKRMPANPFRAIDDRPVMHPYHARRYAKSIGQEVPLDQAVGRVAAEAVEVYPPGIPVILETWCRTSGMELQAIGTVASPLKDLAAAPKQGDEGAPEAWLVFDAGVADGLDGIAAGDELVVLTWLDRARARRAAGPPARRPAPPGAGRLHDALPGPPEPDRPAPGDGAGGRRAPAAGPRPRGARRHAGRRRQAGAGRDRRAVTRLEPELWVGSPRAAIAFYADAFGATVLHQVGEGDDLVAQLAVGEARFWVSNANGRDRLDPLAGGATGRVLLHVDDPDAVAARALAAGATERAPVADEHGWRLGRIADPSGHEWEIGRPLGDWPPAR